LILTQAFHPRAAELAEMAQIAHALEVEAVVRPTVDQALDLAFSSSKAGDAILVTGSLFVVGEVLAAQQGTPNHSIAAIDQSEGAS
jgi:folylpolyglutamate synthase/dihydropteroate synthase